MRALPAFAPDLILVEGPPDADALLPWAQHAEMRPPVAILVYNPKNLEQASFFPFAEFSPEWQAIRYALAQGLALRFMDLPMQYNFALNDAASPELFAPAKGDTAPADPFATIAGLAGYTDPERWWEACVELGAQPGHTDIFEALLGMMQALRDSKDTPENMETQRREAYMRHCIRQAQKDGFQRVAVVCGAWHGPALAAWEDIKASADAALLKGLKKVKTEATWVPWSFDRLAMQSGYGAGVNAPAWYQVLWGQGDAATGVWMTQAAQLLRGRDLPVSSAHVIEAVRMAEALATLRHMALPGIEELRAAAVSVLCDGAESMLAFIDEALVVGDVLGEVPDAANQAPLRGDFEQQAKSCRLKKSTQAEKMALDLREPAQQRKSQLLHRMALLGIPWGQEESVGEGKQGGFHEAWALKWLPDYEIRLIEAGSWGNTVEQAALHRARQQVEAQDALPALAQRIGPVLKAELPALLPGLLARIGGLSAHAQDAALLADVLLPLVQVLRYGTARQMRLDAVRDIVEQVAPRACIQLPGACLQLGDEAAAELLPRLSGLNRAFGLLQMPDLEALWVEALLSIAESEASAALLAGYASRLLSDKKIWDEAQAGTQMRYQLSPGQAPQLAACWLEGFLQGSGLLLLHYPRLWQLVDGWVAQQQPDYFQEILPLLRRTFSRFSASEREKMLDLAKNGPLRLQSASQAGADWQPERAEQVMPLLALILGAER
jgi:hypothetical protein